MPPVLPLPVLFTRRLPPGLPFLLALAASAAAFFAVARRAAAAADDDAPEAANAESFALGDGGPPSPAPHRGLSCRTSILLPAHPRAWRPGGRIPQMEEEEEKEGAEEEEEGNEATTVTTSTGTSLEEEEEAPTAPAPCGPRRLFALALKGKTPAIGRMSVGCGGAAAPCCCCCCLEALPELELELLEISSRDCATYASASPSAQTRPPAAASPRTRGTGRCLDRSTP